MQADDADEEISSPESRLEQTDWSGIDHVPKSFASKDIVFRAQSPDAQSTGSGAGASAATDPDGPLDSTGGLADLTILDAFIHPVEGFGNFILGYNLIAPTSSNRQLGRGEWQLGPVIGALYKEAPKWLLGTLVSTQYSFESNAQQVNVQPIIVRHLQDEWYVGWGEIFWTFDTENGFYNMPLQARVGKVLKIGQQSVNIFVEPFYTPDSLHSGPGGDKWGVKLNITFLYPEKKFSALLGPLFSAQ